MIGMSREISPSNPYNAAAYRKLSNYLLKHEEFGVAGDRPSDGLYFQSGRLTVSDFLTMNSSDLSIAAPDIEKRKEALRTGWAVIDAQVENGPAVTLMRPDTLDPHTMWTELLALRGLDLRRSDIVMIDSRGAEIEHPETHAVAPYIDGLPEPG